MTNGLAQPPYSQDVWPGPPKVLPELLPVYNRVARYALAGYEGATLQEMNEVYLDLGQRIAIESREKH